VGNSRVQPGRRLTPEQERASASYSIGDGHARSGRPRRRRAAAVLAVSLFWRVVCLNAVVYALAAVALALSPATVSFPVAPAEVVVLVVGLLAVLAVNLFLIRRALEPLDRLRSLMRQVDLLRPEQRLDVSGPKEVRELGIVFNQMLTRLQAERRDSNWRALAAQEAERKRVAEELHDEIGQHLTALMLELNGLAERASDGLRDDLGHARESTRATLDHVRAIARRLRPEALDDLGLVPALNALATSFSTRTGIEVERRFESDLPPLTPDAELVVYRVAQESLTNVGRHAEARHVTIDLRRSAWTRSVVLSVADDGRGVDGIGRGSGIRGMRERALMVGGRLRLDSKVGRGVRVTLRVPEAEETPTL
jgi:two-component system, NarL family, sensor histidine kinase UhpB